MNLKQLEVFLAVAETGSFSRAAEATFITQSTVSQHISSLENLFGLKLLDRTGRGALLTEGGKILVQHARQVVTDVQAVKQAMRSFTGMEGAELKIGGSNIPASYMIPDILPLMIRRIPGLRLTVIQGDSREILDKLGREEIELGIVGNRFEEKEFTYIPVGGDAICLIANSRHRWSGRKSVRAEELAGEPLVLRETGSGTGKAVAEALAEAGLLGDQLNVIAYLGSNEAVKRAVGGGMGVSFVSELSIRPELERKELSAIRVEGLSIARTFCLASRTGRTLSPAATEFAGLLRELATQA